MTIKTLEHIHKLLLDEVKLEKELCDVKRKKMCNARDEFNSGECVLGKVRDAQKEYEKQEDSYHTIKAFLDEFEAEEF